MTSQRQHVLFDTTPTTLVQKRRLKYDFIKINFTLLFSLSSVRFFKNYIKLKNHTKAIPCQNYKITWMLWTNLELVSMTQTVVTSSISFWIQEHLSRYMCALYLFVLFAGSMHRFAYVFRSSLVVFISVFGYILPIFCLVGFCWFGCAIRSNDMTSIYV